MFELQHSDNQAAASNAFLYGVLLGGIVGASVALLFAPKPGAELRTELADAGQRFRRKAGEAYTQTSRAVDDMVHMGRSAVRRGQQAAEQAASVFTEPTDSSL